MKKTVSAIALASFLTIGMAEAGDWSRPAKNVFPTGPAPTGSCLSYDYVDLEYKQTDFSNSIYDGSGGFALGFSKSLGSTLYVVGSYCDGSYDYDWYTHMIPVETKKYRLGLGAHKEIAKCTDLTFEGGFEHLDAEYENYADHDYDSWTGYFGPGIRARSGRFEFFAKALYYMREGDFSQEYLYPAHGGSGVHGRVDQDGWVLNPGFIFHLTDRFGLKVAAEFERYDNTYSIGGRYHF